MEIRVIYYIRYITFLPSSFSEIPVEYSTSYF